MTVFIPILSIILYGSIVYLMITGHQWFYLARWPSHPTLRGFWISWLVLLLALAPLVSLQADMSVWAEATINLINGLPLPSRYVYLPVYAQFLAALYWPIYLLIGISPYLLILIIHIPVLISYAYSVNVMVRLSSPKQADIAPLGIVLAPVTIFYLFCGFNHIVMFFCIASALCLLKKEHWFKAGILCGLGCYKFILIPTIFVLWVILLKRRGIRKTLWFTMGGLVTLIPSMFYYFSHIDTMVMIIQKMGAVGAHCHHIEIFHFLHFLHKWPPLEKIYVNSHLWFFLSLSGAAFSIIFFLKKRFNLLQSLGFCSAVVALCALEPFRLEPAIGLLWLDAVKRNDHRIQTVIIILLFAHIFAWFPQVIPAILIRTGGMPLWIWDYRGIFIGSALIYMLGILLFTAKSYSEIIDPEDTEGPSKNKLYL